MANIRYVGLDVHAETFAVAVADRDGGAPVFVGKFPYGVAIVRKVLGKLGSPEDLRVAYEAGPTGYGLYRELAAAGIECHVVAPTLIPVKTGDKVKTDRRDAEKLARCLRSGDLTDVKVVLERIAQMLTKLVKVHQERPGSGAGSGTGDFEDRP